MAALPQSRRFPLPYLAGIAVLLAGTVYLVRDASLDQAMKIVGPAIALLGFCGLLLALRKARRPSPEAAGWRWVCLGLSASVLSNVLMALEPRGAGLAGPGNLLWFLLSAVHQGAAIAAILAWPLRVRSTSRKAINLTGSLVFCGSFLVWVWGLIDWGSFLRRTPLFNSIHITSSIRVCVLGGVTLYLLADRPARLRGPLGWLLMNALGGYLTSLFLYLVLWRGGAWILPLGLVSLVPSAAWLLAAWDPRPVEPEEGPLEGLSRSWELLPYAAFLSVAVLVVARAQIQAAALRTEILLLVILILPLLLRQFLLFLEVRKANRDLEARVQERTLALDQAQALLLRTERLNSLAMIGAGLVHDMNNALFAASMQTELLTANLGEVPEEPAGNLRDLRLALTQATGLTKRLLGYAREEREPLAELELAAELKALERLLRLTLPRNVVLNCPAPALPLWVRASTGRVEQILVNLVGNARDAMPAGGQIRVVLERGADGARLVVADNGPGIPHAIRERIFEPLFSTKEPGKGTGLGLSSVRFLVQELGGRVSLESEVGSGTTFFVDLPLAPGRD